LSDSEILDIMQICKPLSLSGFVASNTGLFKKAQILGARGGATEAYLSGTSKETRRGQRRRWAFFNSPNTSMDDMLLTGAPQGGISGAPLFEKSTDLLQKIRSQTDLPIIGVGGIDSIETAQRKITTGAQLIELYTGFIFEGPSLILRIKKAFKRIQSPLQKS
ncbi:MAG: hypothetical protein HY390_02900, partial [Deltaproteobacteria bacterium]|nr:hypothetical protein [Deltaproteobacteria bacterium]